MILVKCVFILQFNIYIIVNLTTSRKNYIQAKKCFKILYLDKTNLKQIHS